MGIAFQDTEKHEEKIPSLQVVSFYLHYPQSLPEKKHKQLSPTSHSHRGLHVCHAHSPKLQLHF